MRFGLYLFGGDDAFHDAFFIDEESGSQRPHVSPPVHFLFAPHAELPDKAFVRVGNQCERQLVLLDEFLM